LVLMDGVCDGYFSPEKLQTGAKALNEKVLATKADGSFESAWSLYHDSFADDGAEVLDGIYASFMKNYKYVTPTNLNGTITLFKELERPEEAKQMLDYYMANRKEDRAFYDLDESPFGDRNGFSPDHAPHAAFLMPGPHAYCTRMPSIRPVWIGVRQLAVQRAWV